MTSRQLKTLTTDPNGENGQDWTKAASESVRDLYKLNGGSLNLLSTSTANAIVANVEVPLGFDGYTDGLAFQFKANATNTGAMSLSLAGLQPIPMRSRSGVVLAAGHIVNGDLVSCRIENQICYVDLAPRNDDQTDTINNKVKRVWSAQRSVALMETGTLMVFTNVQGDVGDILELPPIIGLANTHHPEHPVGNNGTKPVAAQNSIVWLVNGVGSTADQTVLYLYRDETKIGPIAYVERVSIQTGTTDTGSSSTGIFASHSVVVHPMHTDYVGNLIELTDNQPHDYSLRQEVFAGLSCGLQARGLVKLLSIEGTFT